MTAGLGLLMLAALSCLAPLAAFAAETPRRPEQLDLQPLSFDLPEAQEFRLSNGVTVLFFPDHDLPLITLVARVAMGRRYLPPAEHAACRLLNRVWGEGGAGPLDAEAVDEAVAALGMSLSAGVGLDQGWVTARMVRSDLERGAELWRDLLLTPALEEARIARAREQLLADVRGINDSPRRLAETWFWRLLGGVGSPEDMALSKHQMEEVGRPELIALHTGSVRPAHTVLGISGDLSREEAVELLELLLGSWGLSELDQTAGNGSKAELACEPSFQLPEPYQWDRQTREGIFMLPGDYAQCQIWMGRGVPGLTDRSPDYAAALILDFGIGYGRVFYRTREAGLSYGTGARLQGDADRAQFFAMGGTRPSQVVALIKAICGAVADVETEPLRGEELEGVRTFVLGTRLRRLETVSDAVGVRLTEIVTGCPTGYTADLISALQRIGPEELASAYRRYVALTPEMVLLVVGTPEGGVNALRELGMGEIEELQPVRFGE